MSSSASCPNMVGICQAKHSVPSTSTAISEMDTSSKLKCHERKSSSEDGIHYVDDDDGVEFALDARHLNRVHEELEKLNIATDVINKLELQLDEARANFRQIQSSWSQKLDELGKKYGSAIEKSRPYYATVNEERKLREEAQAAAIRFERANSLLQVAKQQVKLTQDSLERHHKNIEPECLEVLNHHIQRVNEAEKDRTKAEEVHKEIFEKMTKITIQVKQLEKENSRSIKKSKHYFEQCMEFRRKLETQKALISRLEKEVKQKKTDYTTSLRNLEQISDSIHEERSLTSIKQRGSGVATPDTERKVCTSSSSISLKYSTSAVTTSDYGTISSNDETEMTEEKRNSMIADFYQHSPNGFDPLMFDDELESLGELSSSSSGHDKNRSNSGLNGGVILLAQQLLRSESKNNTDGDKTFCFSLDSTDVRYHTMPEGIFPLPSSSEYCSDSDMSSLASGKTSENGPIPNQNNSENTIQRSVSDFNNQTNIRL